MGRYQPGRSGYARRNSSPLDRHSRCSPVRRAHAGGGRSPPYPWSTRHPITRSIVTRYFGHIHRRTAGPFRIEPTHSNMPMKARPWPLLRQLHIPMLYGIQMDVIAMSVPIRFVPDAMFPIPWLPDSALTMLRTTGCYRQGSMAGCDPFFGKQFFDVSPSNWEIVIAFRERP